MNKKALSHVEIIISFVIFIGFLVFFYVIIEPAIKSPQSSRTILQDLNENVLNEISEEVSAYNITLYWEENDGDCTNIGECIMIENSVNKNASVIGKEEIDSYNNISGFISIWCRENCESGEVFTIYYADSFSMKKNSDCQWGLDSKCYSTKFQKKRNYIFESKVNILKDEYSTKYELLKKELEIPAKYKFWFNFLDEKRISKFGNWTEPDIPENVNIYADEIPITYISINNQNPEDKKDGFLVIKMWG